MQFASKSEWSRNMQYTTICNGNLTVSKIGLGCSRLGSVLTNNAVSADGIVKAALDAGITFFDTADIYGQGDSERILGRNCKSVKDAVICTKVGQFFPLHMRLLMPFKAQIKALVARSGSAAGQLASMRSKTLPQSFQSDYLRKATEKSLRRLERDCLDILLLHSIPASEIAKGDAMETLSKLKSEGKIRAIGVSIDDLESAKAALGDPRIEIVQLPLVPGNQAFENIARQLTDKGVTTMAREILGGPGFLSKVEPDERKTFIETRIRGLAVDPGVSCSVIGTGNVKHIKEITGLLS